MRIGGLTVIYGKDVPMDPESIESPANVFQQGTLESPRTTQESLLRCNGDDVQIDPEEIKGENVYPPCVK
jgi:hypothetical protein